MKLGSANNSNQSLAANARQSAGPRAEGAETVSQPLPALALGVLAARLRQAGLMLAAALPDGTIASHEAEAGAFFTKYVLPQLRQGPWTDAKRPSDPSALRLAGCNIGVAPCFERKVHRTTILLAGRSDDFALNEDVLRAAGKLR